MDYKIYQEERKALVRKQEQLNKERKALDKKFAEEHPWNAYKGKKVRITNQGGGTTEPFYFDHIGDCDFMTQQAVGYTVKKETARHIRRRLPPRRHNQHRRPTLRFLRQKEERVRLQTHTQAGFRGSYQQNQS